jgi:hypothetical protein
VFALHPDAISPSGGVSLGVSVLDDAGLIRAWEVMRAQDGLLPNLLVPDEAA